MPQNARMKHPPEPFWNRLRGIALYPFQGAALASMVVYSLGSLLGFLPAGILFSIMVWVAAWRYAFEILVYTAHGQMRAPEVTMHTGTGVVTRFFALMLVSLLALLAAAQLGGVLLVVPAMLLVALLMPGSIMSLAIDGSLPRALNPATPLAVLGRIGGPYFAVVGLLFVIQASASTAAGLLAMWLPGVLAHLVSMAATLWGMFVAFHLMGYLVYQYHEELGFEAGTTVVAPGLPDRDGELLARAQERVADGETAAAITLLEEEMRERAVPLEVHELYRKLLRTEGRQAALLAHSGSYLGRLLLEKQDLRALSVVREALQADPAFTPPEPADGDHLARRARDLGQAGLAVDLWLGMLERWPRDPGRVEWALAAAPLLAQRDRGTLAQEILQRHAGSVDDPELQQRVRSALAALPLA